MHNGLVFGLFMLRWVLFAIKIEFWELKLAASLFLTDEGADVLSSEFLWLATTSRHGRGGKKVNWKHRIGRSSFRGVDFRRDPHHSTSEPGSFSECKYCSQTSTLIFIDWVFILQNDVHGDNGKFTTVQLKIVSFVRRSLLRYDYFYEARTLFSLRICN